jgi:hypothetical protein
MARKKTVVIVEEPTETCKSCRAGWYLESDDESVWFCRLNPPTVTFDPVEQMPVSTFPVVAPDLYCLQFRPRLND